MKQQLEMIDEGAEDASESFIENIQGICTKIGTVSLAYTFPCLLALALISAIKKGALAERL